MINSMITLITMIIETQFYDNHLVRRLMVSARTWCTEVARLLVNLCCCYDILYFVGYYYYYYYFHLHHRHYHCQDHDHNHIIDLIRT